VLEPESLDYAISADNSQRRRRRESKRPLDWGTNFNLLRQVEERKSANSESGMRADKTDRLRALTSRALIQLLTASSAFTQRLELLAVPFTDAESSHRLRQFAVFYPTFNGPLRNAEELSDLVYV
jgi:hypothetical protein